MSDYPTRRLWKCPRCGAADTCNLHEAAEELLEACKSVLAFLHSVRPSDPDDPLRAIQDRLHGPYREQLKAAIAKTERQS